MHYMQVPCEPRNVYALKKQRNYTHYRNIVKSIVNTIQIILQTAYHGIYKLYTIYEHYAFSKV